MARPIKKGLEYFAHDVDMSEDIKVRKLETKFGLAGYAIYNKILEQVYKYNGDFSLTAKEDLQLYCNEWKIEIRQLKKIISYCIEINLFEDEKLISSSIRSRLKKIQDGRKSKREYAERKKQTGDKITNLAEVLEGNTEYNREVISDKVEKSKVKENIEKESKVNADVSLTHILDFPTFHNFAKNENDYHRIAEYDIEYYFGRVMSFYPQNNFTMQEVKQKIIFFIENDCKSDKFNPKKISKPKPDAIAAAYELVKNNLTRIKNFESSDSRDIVSMLMKDYREPMRNNPLFEGYVEKALEYYVT